MTVESSLAVGANIKDLWKFEGVFVVHTENAGDENQHAALDGSWLDVLVVDLVLDVLETEWLNFFGDLLQACVHTSVVAHNAFVVVKVEQVVLVLHDSSVVGLKELFGKAF